MKNINTRIQSIKKNYFFEVEEKTLNADTILSCIGIEYLSAKKQYVVTDQKASKIHILDNDFHVMESIQVPVRPHSLAIMDNNLYISSYLDQAVIKFTLSTKRTSSNLIDKKNVQPHLIAVSNNNKIFIVDGENYIWMFDHNKWIKIFNVEERKIRFLKVIKDNIHVYDGKNQEWVHLNFKGEVLNSVSFKNKIKMIVPGNGFEIDFKNNCCFLSNRSKIYKFDISGQIIFEASIKSEACNNLFLNKVTLLDKHSDILVYDSDVSSIFRVKYYK